MTIKIKVNVHEGSLHETELDVNFGKHSGDAVIAPWRSCPLHGKGRWT
jgi:hypothetical protein